MKSIDYTQTYYDWLIAPDKKIKLLQELLAEVQCVLWDFDGPICDLFSGYPAYRIADALKRELYHHDLLTKEIALQNDPQAIFRSSAPMWNSDDEKLVKLFLWMEHKLTEDELKAAATAIPTNLYQEVVAHLIKRKIKMAVTTNNSPLAVELFFKSWSVRQFGKNVFGRTGPNPDDLKPNTLFLLEAMKKLKVHPSKCLMIGDSVTSLGCGSVVYKQVDIPVGVDFGRLF